MASTSDLLSHITEIGTCNSLVGSLYSFRVARINTLVSAASSAAKHSAAIVEFTTRRIRRLCQFNTQYLPELSTRKIMCAPCEPLSGKLAKLASQNTTIEHDDRS